jgi:hypothetical protein
MARTIFENKPEDITKLEVSRLRWLEDVQNDLRELNMKTEEGGGGGGEEKMAEKRTLRRMK